MLQDLLLFWAASTVGFVVGMWTYVVICKVIDMTLGVFFGSPRDDE
jgi:hypothetical protein